MPASVAPGANAGGFSWLRPVPAPSSWASTSIANGATLSYPPGWGRIHSDKGAATAVLFAGNDHIIGFLNVTPRQGAETLANWSRFRVEHNAEEGDRALRTLASSRGLHFRTGVGSCVKDSYSTISDNHYIELACLVAGKRASTVIVGAAPPQHWQQISPLLERAISGLTT